jgi:hypothetical protein
MWSSGKLAIRSNPKATELCASQSHHPVTLVLVVEPVVGTRVDAVGCHAIWQFNYGADSID